MVDLEKYKQNQLTGVSKTYNLQDVSKIMEYEAKYKPFDQKTEFVFKETGAKIYHVNK